MKIVGIIFFMRNFYFRYKTNFSDWFLQTIKKYKIIKIRRIDLADFIQSNSKNKTNSYDQLNNKDRFAQVKFNGTTLYWENGITMRDYDGSEKPGPLDIDPEYLYGISEPVGNELRKEKSL